MTEALPILRPQVRAAVACLAAATLLLAGCESGSGSANLGVSPTTGAVTASGSLSTRPSTTAPLNLNTTAGLAKARELAIKLRSGEKDPADLTPQERQLLAQLLEVTRKKRQDRD